MIPKTKNTVRLLTRQAILVDTLERFQVNFETELDHPNMQTIARLDAYQDAVRQLTTVVAELRNAVERAH